MYSFTQEEKESMHDCANCLRQYISRCPTKEIPSSQKLISLFLEGWKNNSLHANVYGKKHDTLKECIKDAIDFDDNCEMYGNVDRNIYFQSKASSMKSGKSLETFFAKDDTIADLLVKKMNQVFKT